MDNWLTIDGQLIDNSLTIDWSKNCLVSKIADNRNIWFENFSKEYGQKISGLKYLDHKKYLTSWQIAKRSWW